MTGRGVDVIGRGVDVIGRVAIDPTKCRGHGICALFHADGIDLDRWGYGRVVEGELADRRALRRARRAEAACPNGAVVVVTMPTPVASVGKNRPV